MNSSVKQSTHGFGWGQTAASATYRDHGSGRRRKRERREWQGWADPAEFTAALCDIQKLEVVISTDQLWIRDTWVPLALASGLKRIAVVVALHGPAKFAADAMIRLVGRTGIETRLFNSFDDARNWLDAEEKQARSPR